LSQVPQSCCADQRCPSPLARCSGPLGPDAAARASLAAPGRLGPDTSAHASLAAAPGPLGPDAAARASLAALWDPTPLHTPRSLLLALWDPTLLRTPRSLLLALWDPTPRPPGAHPANLQPCPNAAPSRGSAAGRALLRRGTFLRRARRPGGPSDQPGRAAAAIAPTVRAGTQPRPSQPPGQAFSLPAPPARPPVPRPRRLHPSKRQPHHRRRRFPCHAPAPDPVPERLPRLPPSPPPPTPNRPRRAHSPLPSGHCLPPARTHAPTGRTRGHPRRCTRLARCFWPSGRGGGRESGQGGGIGNNGQRFS
jgi:hypothetical protein